MLTIILLSIATWMSIGVLTAILWTYYDMDKMGIKDLIVTALAGLLVPIVLLIGAIAEGLTNLGNPTVFDFRKRK